MESLFIIAVFTAGVWALNRAITTSGVRPRIMTRNELNDRFSDDHSLPRMSFEIGYEFDHLCDRYF